MSSTPSNRRYFEYKDLPAVWAHGKYPTVITASGEERRVDNLMEFFLEASPITEEEFAELRERGTGRR